MYSNKNMFAALYFLFRSLIEIGENKRFSNDIDLNNNNSYTLHWMSRLLLKLRYKKLIITY